MAQANLKLELLGPIELPIPSISEQELISSQLSAREVATAQLIGTLLEEANSLEKLPGTLFRGVIPNPT
jgi:restriction endonuclease S subunit